MHNTLFFSLFRVSTFLICLAVYCHSAAQTDIEWIKTFGGDLEESHKDAFIDNYDNVYSVGYFESTNMDINPGEEEEIVEALGEDDIFIQKLDSDGNFLWAKVIGTTTSEQANGIDGDSDGNIYITGSFSSTIDFDPNAGIYEVSPEGESETFVLKLDSEGNFVWVQTYGITESVSKGHSIHITNDDNILIGGTCPTHMSFNDEEDGLVGYDGGYILSIDIEGNYNWDSKFYSVGIDVVYDIATDADGGIFFTGNAGTLMHFGDDEIGDGLGVSSIGIYIVKMNSSGDLIWGKTYSGGAYVQAYALTVDGNGDVYATGRIDFDTDFGDGDNEIIVSGFISPGKAYMAKFDGEDGITHWAQGLTNINNACLDVEIIDNTYVYAVGYFMETVDFDPTESIFNLTAPGTTDYDVATYLKIMTLEGDFITASLFISTKGFKPFSTGDFLSYGTFKNVTNLLDFDEDSFVTSNGEEDIYLTKTSVCMPSIVTQQIDACDSYTWIDGITYTENNNLSTVVLTNTEGCDSIISLDLHLNYSQTNTNTISSCNPYTWVDGITYSENNNTAQYTFVSSAGCDSIVSLDFTILSDATNDVVTACDTFVWLDGNSYTESNFTATFMETNVLGCDSLLTLNLTILEQSFGIDEVEACEAYEWIDGNVYTENNNTATHTLTNLAGCDSIVTLNLTIQDLNPSLGIEGSVLSVDIAADSYQWLDCADGFAIIPGANEQEFSAEMNGNYAVEITVDACTYQSNCMEVNSVGLLEYSVSDINIYPNPVFNQLWISASTSEVFDITIVNIAGKVVFSASGISSEKSIDLESLESGLYVIYFNDDNQKTSHLFEKVN